MKKRIMRVTPFQAAKVTAVIQFLVSLPFVVVLGAAFMAAHAPHSSGDARHASAPLPHLPVIVLVIIPFAYLIVGFIIGALGAWLYNITVRFTGGIEYTTTEIE